MFTASSNLSSWRSSIRYPIRLSLVSQSKAWNLEYVNGNSTFSGLDQLYNILADTFTHNTTLKQFNRRKREITILRKNFSFLCLIIDRHTWKRRVTLLWSQSGDYSAHLRCSGYAIDEKNSNVLRCIVYNFFLMVSRRHVRKLRDFGTHENRINFISVKVTLKKGGNVGKRINSKNVFQYALSCKMCIAYTFLHSLDVLNWSMLHALVRCVTNKNR